MVPAMIYHLFQDLGQTFTFNSLENSLGYLESSQAPAQHKKIYWEKE